MNLSSNDFAELCQSAFQNTTISADAIPSIDLYMDQIITLTEGALVNPHERPLTKTMVNNYSKDGLIKPVKGKKYSKEQILQMLLIYNLKQTLAIADIKRVFHGIYENKPVAEWEDKLPEFEHLYQLLLQKQEENRRLIPTMYDKIISPSSEEKSLQEQAAAAIIALCAVSADAKLLASTLAETYFPDPEPEKKEKNKEKKKKNKELTSEEEQENGAD